MNAQPVARAVHIDPTQIPDATRDALAAATLDLFHRILQQPGGREALDAERRKYEAERSEVKNVQS